MERIYHSWDYWEDYKAGFYNNCSGADKANKILLVVQMFDSEILTREFMLRVIEDWKYSCEHNLTNPSLNKIAYIGQAACCIYGEIPSSVTMEAWSLLEPSVQERADKIANEVLLIWESKNA